MIEPTDKMIEAGWDALPVVVRESGEVDLDDMTAVVAAVLAIVEKDYVVLPRGTQALCCHIHTDHPVRWGTCGKCVAELPPEERT